MRLFGLEALSDYANRLREDALIRTCIVSSIAFFFVAHGYCFLNTMYSHDSLARIFWTDIDHNISIGRYLQPIYVHMRGEIAAPMLIGALSLVWFIGASCLIVKLFELKKSWAVVLAVGILATNYTVTLTNATYMTFSDVFMLALFLSVLGVWLARRSRFGIMLGAICFMLSLGLYQAYIQVSLTLVLCMVFCNVLKGESWAIILRDAVSEFASLIAGVILYAISVMAVLKVTGITAISAYNGLANIGDYSNVSMLDLLMGGGIYPLLAYLAPLNIHPRLIGIINVMLLMILLCVMIVLVRGKDHALARALVCSLLLAIMPYFINAAYFMSKGMVHELMTYSLFVPYIMFVCCIENLSDFVQDKGCNVRLHERFGRCASCLGGLGLLVIIATNCMYSNDVYLKKDLEWQGTLSLMTRIIDRVETTSGYVPGETPVLILGKLDSAEVVSEHKAFTAVPDGVGLASNVSISYYGAAAYPVTTPMQSYLDNVLGEKFNLVNPWESDIDSEIIESMPAFPDAESVTFVNGTLVVKLSSS